MEGKINISTIFLVLAIIVIAFMGVYIYKINNEKVEEIQKSQELQNQVSDLNNSLNSLQEKIDKISNTINNNSSSNNENKTTISGTYKYEDTTISFVNDNFVVGLDDYFSLDGSYEITDSKTIVCTISSHTSSTPEGPKTIDTPQNEKWVITFNMIDNNSIEVKDVSVPDREIEIVIGIYNKFEKGRIFLIQ